MPLTKRNSTPIKYMIHENWTRTLTFKYKPSGIWPINGWRLGSDIWLNRSNHELSNFFYPHHLFGPLFNVQWKAVSKNSHLPPTTTFRRILCASSGCISVNYVLKVTFIETIPSLPHFFWSEDKPELQKRESKKWIHTNTKPLCQA